MSPYTVAHKKTASIKKRDIFKRVCGNIEDYDVNVRHVIFTEDVIREDYQADLTGYGDDNCHQMIIVCQKKEQNLSFVPGTTIYNARKYNVYFVFSRLKRPKLDTRPPNKGRQLIKIHQATTQLPSLSKQKSQRNFLKQ